MDPDPNLIVQALSGQGQPAQGPGELANPAQQAYLMHKFHQANSQAGQSGLYAAGAARYLPGYLKLLGLVPALFGGMSAADAARYRGEANSFNQK